MTDVLYEDWRGSRNDRRVATGEAPGVEISTSLLMNGRYETMLFVDREGPMSSHNNCSCPYDTLDEARAGHERFVRLAEVGICGSCEEGD